ncbi:MAG: hypothetical protein ACTIOK_03375 [Enterococcus malodoratus]
MPYTVTRHLIDFIDKQHESALFVVTVGILFFASVSFVSVMIFADKKKKEK